MRFRWHRDPRVRDEVRFHRDRLIDDYVASGMDRHAAERRAFLELGNLTAIEELQELQHACTSQTFLKRVQALTSNVLWSFKRRHGLSASQLD